MNTLNPRGQKLSQLLSHAYSHETYLTRQQAHGEMISVVGAGGMVTAAYEQLRNAAENTEEHLLLQHAIRRFFRQIFITRDNDLIAKSGNELTVELTLAGYIPNNSLSYVQSKKITDLAIAYYSAYEKLLENRLASPDRAEHWTLDVLAVQAEAVINDHIRDTIFLEFAFDQFSATLDKKTFASSATAEYGPELFVAIHQALLKSDEQAIRTSLLERYQANVAHLEQYVTLNKHFDALFQSTEVDTLRHAVDRHGAPLRIIYRMMYDCQHLDTLLSKRDAFLAEYEKAIQNEYARIGSRINRAIIRSVIFLIITKVLIGVAIEVPYDLWVHHEIIWMPLIINLLFPPIYMVALRATQTLPGYANTAALVDRIDTMLYGQKNALSSTRQKKSSYSGLFYIAYTLISMTILGLAVYGLVLLRFEAVHIMIFMIFMSAASFLGFRLSRLIRELEVINTTQNGLTFLRDLIYLPFVVVGRWISDKYSRVNIITIILDMLIELPLKTVLRLIRQWAAFIDDRKDRL